MSPLIAVAVVLLALVALYFILGAFRVVEPWRSGVLALGMVLGILYLVGAPLR